MELGLFGKEKLRSFWQILADIGLRLHAFAYGGNRSHPVASSGNRSHPMASNWFSVRLQE